MAYNNAIDVTPAGRAFRTQEKDGAARRVRAASRAAISFAWVASSAFGAGCAGQSVSAAAKARASVSTMFRSSFSSIKNKQNTENRSAALPKLPAFFVQLTQVKKVLSKHKNAARAGSFFV